MDAKRQAQQDFSEGLGLNENPYPKGSKDYEVYMMEMARLEFEEFTNELLMREGAYD